MIHLCRSLGPALVLAAWLTAGPAAAAPKPTPTPHPDPFGLAQTRVQRYLKSVPGLPPNVTVVPATGTMPWPGEHARKDITAEVWTAVAGGTDEETPHILMLFAVRPDTGEVFALHMRSLQQHPTYLQ